MSRYETHIDLTNPNNSQTQIVKLVGPDQAVLDVGCASGDTAAAMVEQGCRVSGVDIEDAVPPDTRALMQDVVVADIEKTPLTTLFKPESFDAVVFGDVLEHLVDPLTILRDAVALLAPEGRIVVSIPNVAHAAVRLSLLEGRWDYTSTGLLDATHLRFFTRESACRLLEDAGLVIEVLQSTVLDPLETEISISGRHLPATVVEWVRHQPDALNYQYIATARVLAPGEERPPRPALQPLLAPVAVRHQDAFSQELREQQEDVHREITQRDHIIGLEATLVAADSRTKRAQARQLRLKTRAKRLRTQLLELIEEVERLPENRQTRAVHELARAVRPPGDGRDREEGAEQ